MSEHGPAQAANGRLLQSGTPKRPPVSQPLRARGLMLRGVVVATFVVDDPTHPQAQGTTPEGPKAVYCDVITYGNRPGMQTRLVKGCLVLHRRGGLHDGDIWLPKATTKDTTGSDLDRNVGSNSAYWDGDHVLVGFMDDDLALPIIMGGVAHPAADTGVAEQGEAAAERRQLHLHQVDGHPDYTKHHGSWHGIDNDGNHVIDTRFANDGSLDDVGAEPAPPTDGKGSQTRRLPLDATFQLTLDDMSTPATPDPKVTITVTKDSLTIVRDNELTVTLDADKFHVLFEGGFEFLVDDAGSKIHLGGDAEEAVIERFVQREFSRITNEINQLKWKIGQMRDPVVEFLVPILFGDIIPCFKQPAIYTVKGQPPINLRTGSEVGANNAPMDTDASVGEYFGAPIGPTVADLLPGADDPADTFSDTVKLKS